MNQDPAEERNYAIKVPENGHPVHLGRSNKVLQASKESLNPWVDHEMSQHITTRQVRPGTF